MVKFAKHDVFLRELADRRTKVRQLLWGDFLNVEEELDGGFKVRWGREGHYWIRREDTQDTRPLEVVFVDVGQGDGCLLVTPDTGPDEKVLLIDAGEGRNMYNFVKWRFGGLDRPFRFHAAVVTHSDQDHYGGFQPFFDDQEVSFSAVHHNGIAERSGPDLFGPTDPSGRFLTDIIAGDAQLRALYADPAVRGAKRYPKLMHTALTAGRVGKVEMLSTAHGAREGGRSWLPGFSPSQSPDLTIVVLGPVVEPDAAGHPRLRWFGDTPGSSSRNDGKTKNGHSVLLRLTHHNFTLLFGGDLNLPAEDFLLRHYGALAPGQPLSAAVEPARARFRADVMKSCHHGSADVTDEFLQAVQPFAFTVSSGDEESHVHPRPDLLGRLGRHGRGEAPLVLCTEILRSGREREDGAVLERINKLNELIERPATTEVDREAHRKERAAQLKVLGRRNVEVYGAITLRTDGDTLVIAFRLEKPRSGSAPKRWQTYTFRHEAGRGFVPTP